MARTRNDQLHVTRKRQILSAARRCFVKSGIHSASMQDICRTGKISPGALYRYFPSKQSIIEAIAEEEHQQNAELIDYLRTAQHPAKGLCDAVPDVLDTILDRDFAKLMIEISTEANHNSQVHAIIQKTDTQFKADLVAIFSAAQKDNRIGKHVDVETAIFVFLSMIDGITARAATSSTPAKKQLVAATQKAVIALFE
ncbi:TetR/AcrR family transcriptional regulator [Maritalea sp.]|uniref:TetR/AcrR family transcriptional regulator n=1 Tax=Maritalea sp. TaxID=2003361 RepID=UPI003EF4C546